MKCFNATSSPNHFTSIYQQTVLQPNERSLLSSHGQTSNDELKFNESNINKNFQKQVFSTDLTIKRQINFIPNTDKSKWQTYLGIRYLKDQYSLERISPLIGLQYRLLNQNGYFWLENLFTFEQNLSESTLRKNQKTYYSDPRFGFAYSHFKNFSFNNEQNDQSKSFFIDIYGESVLIPRWNRLPITLIQPKFGKRFSMSESSYRSHILDVYVELWTRFSPIIQLGSDRGELRWGLRFQPAPIKGLSFLFDAHEILNVWRGENTLRFPYGFLFAFSGDL